MNVGVAVAEVGRKIKFAAGPLFFARTLFSPNRLLGLAVTGFMALSLVWIRYDFDLPGNWNAIINGTLDRNALLPLWYANIIIATVLGTWTGKALTQRLDSAGILLLPRVRESIVSGVVTLALVPCTAALLASRSPVMRPFTASLIAMALLLYSAGVNFRMTARSKISVVIFPLLAIVALVAPSVSLAAAERAPFVVVPWAVIAAVFLLQHVFSDDEWRLRTVNAMESSSSRAGPQPDEDDFLWATPREHEMRAREFAWTIPALESGPIEGVRERIVARLRAYTFVARHNKAGALLSWRGIGLASIGYLVGGLMTRLWTGTEIAVPVIVMILASWETPLEHPGLSAVPRVARARVTFWSTTLRTLASVALGVASYYVARIIFPEGWDWRPEPKPDFQRLADRGITWIGILAFFVALIPIFHLMRAAVLSRGGLSYYPHSRNLRAALLLIIGWILVVPVAATLAIGPLSPAEPNTALRLLTLILGNHALLYFVLRWRYSRVDLAHRL